MSYSLEPILNSYPMLQGGYHAAPIGNGGGFSGAKVWKVTSGGRSYCLKQWPETYPERPQLQFIHDVLRQVHQLGALPIAVPVANQTGQSICCRWDGNLFELTAWLPGEADFEQRPTARKLVAAMTVLARFHTLAAIHRTTMGISEGLVRRRDQIAALIGGELNELRAAIQPRDWPLLAPIARAFLEQTPRVLPHVRYFLERASAWQLPLQPCIRDIWHDHVLFTNEEVTGVIDFGAMKMDNVATDLARLIGSLVADDPQQRAAALAAYETVRPLSPAERELVTVFDQSSTVLSGIHWLRWIYCEGRVFENRRQVEKRLQFLLRRLGHLSSPKQKRSPNI